MIEFNLEIHSRSIYGNTMRQAVKKQYYCLTVALKSTAILLCIFK